MLPFIFNNNVQIFQTREYVTIYNEMIHSARIVPMDGRPHGTIRQWMGDSRGHWEGSTLVVDTVNFSDKASFRGSAGTFTLSNASRAPAGTQSSIGSRWRIRRSGRNHGLQSFQCARRRGRFSNSPATKATRAAWKASWERRALKTRGPSDTRPRQDPPSAGATCRPSPAAAVGRVEPPPRAPRRRSCSRVWRASRGQDPNHAPAHVR